MRDEEVGDNWNKGADEGAQGAYLPFCCMFVLIGSCGAHLHGGQARSGRRVAWCALRVDPRKYAKQPVASRASWVKGGAGAARQCGEATSVRAGESCPLLLHWSTHRQTTHTNTGRLLGAPPLVPRVKMARNQEKAQVSSVLSARRAALLFAC